MKKSEKNVDARTHLVGTGLFVSVPDVFEGAEEILRHFAKVNLALQSTHEKPTATETVVLSDRILFDIGALKSLEVDAKKIIKDCEIIKKIASDHPEELQSLIELATKNDSTGAARLAAKLGLTEQASLKKGGGLLHIVVVLVIAIAASSCKGCAHNPKSPGKVPDYNDKKQ